MVGAGVLALPYTFVYLGWIAGPLVLAVAFFISFWTSLLQADTYQVDGLEFGRYRQAVRHILSTTDATILSAVQTTLLVFVTITYTVSPAISMRRIALLSCEYTGTDPDDCFDDTWKMAVLFGAVQIPLSIVPNLESLRWISSVGALSSFTYAFIALVLGLKYAGNRLGSVGGLATTAANKSFGSFRAVGSIFSAFGFHAIIVEIQDTLRQPPRASVTMKKTLCFTLGLVFVLFMLIAVGGYASLGDDTPSYILAGYSQAPNWVMILANASLVLHIASAFQLYAQPIFDTLETNVRRLQRRLARPRGEGPRDTAADDGGIKTVSLCTAREDDWGREETLEQAPTGERRRDAAISASAGRCPQLDAAPASAAAACLERASKGARSRDGSSSRDDAVLCDDPTPEEDALGGGAERGSTALAAGGSSAPHPDHALHLSLAPVNVKSVRPLPLVARFAIRSAYVVAITVISCCMPFFSDIAGLTGAVCFWPVAVYYPIQMWRRVFRPRGWLNLTLICINWTIGAASILGIIGAVRGIIISSSTYKVFGND